MKRPHCLAAPALLLFATPAAAAGGQSSATALSTIVLLLGFIAGAYLITHFVIDQLQRRFLFNTGLEFIVLGALLGPAVPQIRVFDDFATIAPIIALAAGWVGLVYGLGFDLRQALRAQDHAVRLGAIDAIATGSLVAVTAHWAFSSGYLGPIDPEEASLAAGLLGCTAAAGSSSAVDLLSRLYRRTDGLLDLLAQASRLGDLVAIFAFGTMFALFHQGDTTWARPPTPSDWFLVTVGIGVVLGVLFNVFLDRRDSENERFVALVGIITFASGAAYLLHLSGLLVNLILGFMLANIRANPEALRDTLRRTSRPVALLLLIFAGALWQPVPWWETLLVGAGYLVVRLAGKILGCFLAASGTPMRRDLARGLMAQGDVAVAMALSFRLVYDGPAIDLAYTAVLVSVMVNEFIAPRVLKGLLIDAGEVREELPAMAGG